MGARERGPQSSWEEKKEGWERVNGAKAGRGCRRGRGRAGRSPPCCPTHLDSQRSSHLLPGAVGHRPSPGQVFSPVNWATCTGSGVCGLSRTPRPPGQAHPCPLCHHLPFPPSQLLAQKTPLTACSPEQPPRLPAPLPLPSRTIHWLPCLLSSQDIRCFIAPIFPLMGGKTEVPGRVSLPHGAPGPRLRPRESGLQDPSTPWQGPVPCLPVLLGQGPHCVKARCQSSLAATFLPAPPLATPPLKGLSHVLTSREQGSRERKWPWQPQGVGGPLV